MRHANALVELVEEATGVPQADASPDEGENRNAKPHAKFQSLIIHCKPPRAVLISRVRRQRNCVSLVRTNLPAVETYPLVGEIASLMSLTSHLTRVLSQ